MGNKLPEHNDIYKVKIYGKLLHSLYHMQVTANASSHLQGVQTKVMFG